MSANLHWVQGNDGMGIIQTWQIGVKRGRTKRIWSLIPFAIWWATWLGKNDCVFNSKEILADDLIAKAKG
ncbi:hypothetical protein BVC80_8989g38 [Macleaya cordata]|uniref:Uncharacterized protein n=1 Tax=Macleaya cordata TaxID=56857 RepID=A0A200Q8H8_MACCD|nr:hypothetical protein BVC80_8989g38 [Macleaya cordata]